MLQIKTIKEKDTKTFDVLVNKALADGWKLVSRTSLAVLNIFQAELEKETITEDERCCENCKHRDLHPEKEPCFSCLEDCSNWEAEE